MINTIYRIETRSYYPYEGGGVILGEEDSELVDIAESAA